MTKGSRPLLTLLFVMKKNEESFSVSGPMSFFKGKYSQSGNSISASLDLYHSEYVSIKDKKINSKFRVSDRKLIDISDNDEYTLNNNIECYHHMHKKYEENKK